MTKHGDEEPLAPRRPLQGQAAWSDAPTQSMPRVDAPEAGDGRWGSMNAADEAGSSNSSDPQTGKPIPVPPDEADPEAADRRREELAAERAEAERRRVEDEHTRAEGKRQATALKEARRANARRPRQTRRARLRLTRVDPWSVTKIAFLLSIAFGVMCVVAVFFIFSILNASGVWTHINEAVQGVLNQSPQEAFDITDYVNMSQIMGVTMLIAAVDVILITALATLGAFIYNLAASMLGGLEVTLAEDLK